MGFILDQGLVLIKTVIELTDSLRGFDVTKIPPHKRTWIEDYVVVFYERAKLILLGYHNGLFVLQLLSMTSN